MQVRTPGHEAYIQYTVGRTRPDGSPYFGWSELTPNERDHWEWAAKVADARKPPQQYSA